LKQAPGGFGNSGGGGGNLQGEVQKGKDGLILFNGFAEASYTATGTFLCWRYNCWNFYVGGI